jgi:hypothetical protein
MVRVACYRRILEAVIHLHTVNTDNTKISLLKYVFPLDEFADFFSLNGPSSQHSRILVLISSTLPVIRPQISQSELPHLSLVNVKEYGKSHYQVSYIGLP